MGFFFPPEEGQAEEHLARWQRKAFRRGSAASTSLTDCVRARVDRVSPHAQAYEAGKGTAKTLLLQSLSLVPQARGHTRDSKLVSSTCAHHHHRCVSFSRHGEEKLMHACSPHMAASPPRMSFS